MIESAIDADIPEIVRVNILSWQQAYQGLIPDGILSGLSADDKLSRWQQGFRENRFHILKKVLDEKIVGYVCFGKYRDQVSSNQLAEIYSIYLLKEYWERGIGSQLITEALSKLRSQDYQRCACWVLDTNQRGIRFYQRHGFRTDGSTKLRDIEGTQLREQKMLRKL